MRWWGWLQLDEVSSRVAFVAAFLCVACLGVIAALRPDLSSQYATFGSGFVALCAIFVGIKSGSLRKDMTLSTIYQDSKKRRLRMGRAEVILFAMMVWLGIIGFHVHLK